MDRRRIINLIVSIMLLTVLLVMYGLSFYFDRPIYWESVLITTVVFVLYFAAVLRLTPYAVSFFTGDEQPHQIQTGDRTYRRCGARELAKLVLLILALRLLELVLTYIVHYLQFGYTSTFFEVERVWLDFYQADNAFPLYKYLSNVFWIFTFNFNHARFIGSYVFTALAGAALYALVLFDFDRKTARRALRFFFFLPVSCLLMGSVPDGLFLLLSALALLFMRKREFWAANIFGMLASATHALGALLFFPILVEYIAYIVGNVRSNREMEKGYLTKQIINALSFVLIPIGVATVMLYAYLSFGDPFILYQRVFGNEPVSITSFPGSMIHWLDGVMGSMRTITVQTVPSMIAVVLPQILYLLAACLLIIFGSGKVEPSYLLLMTLTVPAIFLANQTNDAAHMLTLTIPFVITLSVCIKKRWLDALFTVLFIVGWLAYFYAFITGLTGGIL